MLLCMLAKLETLNVDVSFSTCKRPPDVLCYYGCDSECMYWPALGYVRACLHSSHYLTSRLRTVANICASVYDRCTTLAKAPTLKCTLEGTWWWHIKTRSLAVSHVPACTAILTLQLVLLLRRPYLCNIDYRLSTEVDPNAA